MIRALVAKELRESLPLAAAGGLGALLSFDHLTGGTISRLGGAVDSGAVHVPFVTDEASTTVLLLGGALGAVLGLKQTGWEELCGTYHYLFHRPLMRDRIVQAKLAVGAALALGVTGSLIILLALWARIPGHVAAPFEWSMTAAAWQAWMAAVVVYLAAFLTGLRPAHWMGTRPAPLIAGGTAAAGIANLPWWPATLAAAAALSALLVCCIQHVAATRDY